MRALTNVSSSCTSSVFGTCASWKAKICGDWSPCATFSCTRPANCSGRPGVPPRKSGLQATAFGLRLCRVQEILRRILLSQIGDQKCAPDLQRGDSGPKAEARSRILLLPFAQQEFSFFRRQL